MRLTLRYSLQNSSIKPSNITGEYARLKVDSRPEQDRITISNVDYQRIVQALSEGRLIGLQNENGLHLGQFMTSLSGGVVVQDFKSPAKSDVKASFKPTQQMLNDVRELVSFERVATVKHNPIIYALTFTDNTGNISTGNIPISTNGLLHITGDNFVKNEMQIIISQASSGAKIKLSTQVKSGVKYIDALVSNTDIDTANSFTTGKAELIVIRKDNTQRKYEYQCEII